MRTVVGGLSGFFAATTPSIVLGGVGYAIGAHHAYELSAGFGVALGVIGGGLASTAQFGSDNALVPTFNRLGHRYPYLASCLNVTLCAGVPAALAGYAASHYANGGWGVAAAVVAGVLGMIYCDIAQAERFKDAEAKTQGTSDQAV